jgi:hypothetical protein
VPAKQIGIPWCQDITVPVVGNLAEGGKEVLIHMGQALRLHQDNVPDVARLPHRPERACAACTEHGLLFAHMTR